MGRTRIDRHPDDPEHGRARAAPAPPLAKLLLLGHPEVSRVGRRVAGFAPVNEDGLMMTIGVAPALYGTHVINAPRREAFEARRLGPYRLRRLIGAGGMGVVHLAEHRLLKRPCAIKLIRPAAAGDPTGGCPVRS
jgi:serine/threonine-protein kinase